jgi:hypothetical protein
MKEITLTVTIDEANLILEGIGLLPFTKVFQLVGKLQEQARRQLDGDSVGAGARPPASTPRT